MRQVIKKRLTSCGAAGAQDNVQAELEHGKDSHQPRTPGVRLVHVDGRVQALEVTCRCGDVSVIEIEYEQ